MQTPIAKPIASFALLAQLLCLACSSPASPAAVETTKREAVTSTSPVAKPSSSTFTAPDARGFGRAGELVYFEEVVGDAAATDRLPMIVLIHGRGDRPQRGWLPLQLPKAVRVIMPQAPLPHGDGFSWSRASAAEASGPSGIQLAADLTRMADRIDAALTILKTERPTLGIPLLGGFSQGGMLSYAIAVLHPSACTLAIPISGLLPQALFPKQKPTGASPRIRALHGTADTIVPIAPARTAVTHLAQKGYDATLTEHPEIPHTITPSMVAQINAWLSAALATKAL